MTFAGPKKRRSERTKLPTWINGARNKAITLMEDSGSDGIRGSRAMRATEKFLVFTELVMLDDRG